MLEISEYFLTKPGRSVQLFTGLMTVKFAKRCVCVYSENPSKFCTVQHASVSGPVSSRSLDCGRGNGGQGVKEYTGEEATSARCHDHREDRPTSVLTISAFELLRSPPCPHVHTPGSGGCFACETVISAGETSLLGFDLKPAWRCGKVGRVATR